MQRSGFFERALLAAATLISLAGCARTPTHNPLATWVPSANFNARRPMLIVLHYTEQQSVQESLQTLRDRNAGERRVSAHYLVGADGRIYQLVDENARAWHAGAGRWGDITDLNSASIGIEIDNDGHAPFADAQIASLLALLEDLTQRLKIPRDQIIGHEDLAPTRKVDPGPLFPWQRLADAGFGRWPRTPFVDPPADFDPWLALVAVGYSIDDRPAALHAFRDHFRGGAGTGDLDDEDRRILYALTRETNPS